MELSKGEVTATNILTRLLRLQQITGGFIRSDIESERNEYPGYGDTRCACGRQRFCVRTA